MVLLPDGRVSGQEEAEMSRPTFSDSESEAAPREAIQTAYIDGHRLGEAIAAHVAADDQDETAGRVIRDLVPTLVEGGFDPRGVETMAAWLRRGVEDGLAAGRATP
jgi:hypothetical protein